MTESIIPQKPCIKCGIIKPLSEFPARKDSKDGTRNDCKVCLADRKSRYAEEHKLHIKEYMVRYRKDNQDKIKAYESANRERLNQYARERRAKMSEDAREKILEKTRQRSRKYYENNRAKIIAQTTAWRKNNPEKYREIDRRSAKKNHKKIIERHKRYHNSPEGNLKFRLNRHRRYSLKKGTSNPMTEAQWVECLKYWGYCCAYCGSSGNGKPIEMDHFISIIANGDYSQKNMLPACKSCNASKNDDDPQKWIKWKFPERSDEILDAIQKYFAQISQ